MRGLVYLSLTLCVASVASAAVVVQNKRPNNCDQKIYDQLYAELSRQTQDNAESYNRRISTLGVLRGLCRGQKSSFEKAGAQ